MADRPTSPSVRTWQALLRYQRSASKRLDDDLRRRRSVTLEEYDVLYQLSANDGTLRMTALSDAVLITRSSCTRLVDRLVSNGWVEREPVPTDRRAIDVRLTPSGRSVLRRAAVTHLQGIEREFSSRLSERDVSDLERILEHLTTVRTPPSEQGDHR